MGQIRFEEYAPLGDFLMKSFVRDHAAIEVRFPKLDSGYVTAFQNKLADIKKLEGTFKLGVAQKQSTVALYAEADAVNKELNFLSSYFKDAGLPTDAITHLKRSLSTGNIEGALLELKDVRQYVAAHQAELEAEGMAPEYPDAMEAHRVSMERKNALQNSVLDTRKQLVDANKAEYKALYDYIKTVAEKGKLIFKGTVYEDQYNLTKMIARMRAPKQGGGKKPTP